MFATNEALRTWANALKLSEDALKIIQKIRESEPSARVRSSVRSVSGRYPSRKMQRTIQFATHRNVLPVIYDMEHDPDVIEFWDLPPSINLAYTTKSGRRHGGPHTANFFVIRNNSAGWVECRIEKELIKLAGKQPGRFQKDDRGVWHCLPGEDYASSYGLDYTVKSDTEIDWVFQRNILFLEDYLLEDTVEVPEEVTTYILSLVTAKPGITLDELLSIMRQHNLQPHRVYQLIVTAGLYVDLSECVLAKPEKVPLYFNQEVAAMYGSGANNPLKDRRKLPSLLPNSHIKWGDNAWRIVNRDVRQTWLQDSESRVIKLDNSSIDQLIEQGSITRFLETSDLTTEEDEEIFSQLYNASPAELAEANRRYSKLRAFQSGELSAEEANVCIRTLYYWQARFKAAEEQLGAGYLGLLPNIHSRGNRQPKLPEETIGIMKECIATKYENLKQPSIYSAWTELIKTCEDRGIVAPSYQTFCLAVRKRPTHRQQVKRQGKRGGYKSEPFYIELNLTTPRHGDRPFEICHIDHTELDVELICSETGENLGRPWLTLLIDAHTRLILAFCLLFDPPSYRSCMMVLRECVRKHNRLPQTLVLDGDRVFSSVYFEGLLARYRVVKKTRPPSKARFGSVGERIFGSTNTRLIYNLAGNTQLTKTNARYVTKEVDPKKHAPWTLPALHGSMTEYFYNVYPTIDHPALGQSPQTAFLAAQARSGQRVSRDVRYNEEFLMMTLPATVKGNAKVVPGRGVKINYIFYWCEAFRNPEVEGTRVKVRYDPFNIGQAYAYVQGHWRKCTSEHYLLFSKCSEQELKLASAEIRRRNQQHGKRFFLNARKIANFLRTVGEKEFELRQQRKRDAELRRVQARVENAYPEVASLKESDTGSAATATDISASGEVSYRIIGIEDVPDFSQLETYEEYK